MEKDDAEAANVALLLDEKIDERIHVAVGKLFGFDVVKNHYMPSHDPTSTAGMVRSYIMRDTMREIAREIANDPEVVRRLYENLLHIQHQRRTTWTTSTSTGQQFF